MFNLDNSLLALDDDHCFNNNAYADIQRWLGGIIHSSHQDSPLRSPIRIHDARGTFQCPPIARKRRCSVAGSVSHSNSPSPGCIRTASAKRIRVAQRSSYTRPAFRLPRTRRFFDSANWMDQADEDLALAPNAVAQSPWRDAYTVTISSRPRRSMHLRRGSTVSVSAAPSPQPITLPVCLPMNLSLEPRTPIRVQTQLASPDIPHFGLPETPGLISCVNDVFALDTASTTDSRPDMPDTPSSPH